MKRRTLIFGLALLLTSAGAALAHEGHSHTVMGTVTAVHGNQLELKTADGKAVNVTLNEKTAIARGPAKLTVKQLAVGQRVVVDVGDGKAPLVAHAVRIGQERKLAAGHADTHEVPDKK